MGRVFTTAGKRVFSSGFSANPTGVSDPFTVCAWVRAVSWGASRRIAVNRTSGNIGFILHTLSTGSNDGFRISLGNGVTFDSVDGSSGKSTGTWYFVMLHRSGTTGSLFVNDMATAEATVTNATYSDGDQDFTSGANPGSTSGGWDGDIAEVAWFDRALSVGERRACMRWGAHGLDPDLYWPLFGAGDPEADLSGHGRNGSLASAPAKGPHPPVTRYAHLPRFVRRSTAPVASESFRRRLLLGVGV